MLNKCPVSSYEQVCNVIKKELGDTPDKVYTICFSPNRQRHCLCVISSVGH